MNCALWLAEIISRHFFNQSEATIKSVVTWSHATSRAQHQLHLLWVLIGCPKEGHPPLPPPGSAPGKSAFRNSAQRSDTTINDQTKKEKNKQNKAVLSWPKNTLLASSVKYWTPLTTKMYNFTTVEQYTFRTYCIYPAIPGCDTNTIATWRHWNRRHPHVCKRVKSFHGFQSRRVITATADVKKRT